MPWVSQNLQSHDCCSLKRSGSTSECLRRTLVSSRLSTWRPQWVGCSPDRSCPCLLSGICRVRFAVGLPRQSRDLGDQLARVLEYRKHIHIRSILFPRIRNGVFANGSIASNASNSALLSANRSWSLLSTRNTIPLTSGKYCRRTLETFLDARNFPPTDISP